MATVVEVETVTVTDKQRTALLVLVAKTPGIGIAAALREVGVAGTKGQLRDHVANDPDLHDDIQEARGHTLRQELMSRAIDGVEEAVYTPTGKLAGTRVVKSDRLLEFACRMYLPEAQVLRSGHVELTGADRGPVQVQRGVSLAEVAAVLSRAQALPAGPDIIEGEATELPDTPS